MRSGPDIRLVRLLSRVLTLERAQEAEADGRAQRHDTFVQRHARGTRQ